MAERIGVYPGTFDPITLGHIDIIRRGAHLVDKLVIGVTTNPSKEPMFSIADRMAMVRRETGADSGVQVAFGGQSGIGTAANFWAANVGTETSGSLLNPANLTMLVAIKPTVGRISRHGIIPLTAEVPDPLQKPFWTPERIEPRVRAYMGL